MTDDERERQAADERDALYLRMLADDPLAGMFAPDDDREPPHSCLDPDLGDLATHLLDAADAIERALDAAVSLRGGDRRGRGGWPAMIALARRLEALEGIVITLPGPEIKAAIEAEYRRQLEERDE